jgi:phage-related protein
MPRVLPTGAEAMLARQALQQKAILLDIQTMDGTQYFWSDYPGIFVSKITGANQLYSPWIKKAGPFRRSKDNTTDAGDIIVQNLSGNTIERDVAKAVTAREFDGAFAVLRVWLPLLDAALDEYHGYLSDQKPSSEEFRFRLLQLMDASQYDVADDPVQDLCTLDYKSAQCGSAGSATDCGKRFKLDCQDATAGAGALQRNPGTGAGHGAASAAACRQEEGRRPASAAMCPW